MAIAGVDGCKGGWICIVESTVAGEIESRVETTASLLALAAELEVLAIDIPIGLPDSGSRACDIEARKLLGRPRGSSVFPAPVRPALHAESRSEASKITARIDGRRVGVQAWNIMPKIKEVDWELQRAPHLRSGIREVHPEVSFRAWNNSTSMRASKKRSAGRRERRQLVDRVFGPSAYETIRGQYLVKEAAHDDILDAFAALWTARRLVKGEAVSLPGDIQRDSTGLRMEIVY
ncbi:MAG: DUF429 domain-containing protein [bacterium]|nr:DUF429 domain-containing protein [bacterium]